MHRLNRNIGLKINKLLDLFPVVVVLGARQVGKTTLCRYLRPDWHYFDLHNPQHFDLACIDPLAFFNHYPEHVIIDEAQENQGFLKTLRGVIDQNRTQKGRFLITGSSSPTLLNRTAETLAGRAAIVQLGTLKANEVYACKLSDFYQIFHDLNNTYEILKSCTPAMDRAQFLKHWLVGGYPEPTIDYHETAYKQWMDNYFTTYINTDLSMLFPALKKHVFQRFIKMLSRLNGTIVNKSDLARSLEISEKTVNEYIHIAEGTFLWRSLLSYQSNLNKSLVKMPKGYLRDTGLLHYLTRIYDFEELYQHPMSGRSFESFIIEELINGLMATLQTNWQPFYYRTKHGAEIDLILEGDWGILPVEIKQGVVTSRKSLMSLEKFVKDHKLSLGLVINQSHELCWLSETILQVPFHYV